MPPAGLPCRGGSEQYPACFTSHPGQGGRGLDPLTISRLDEGREGGGSLWNFPNRIKYNKGLYSQDLFPYTRRRHNKERQKLAGEGVNRLTYG